LWTYCSKQTEECRTRGNSDRCFWTMYVMCVLGAFLPGLTSHSHTAKEGMKEAASMQDLQCHFPPHPCQPEPNILTQRITEI
jgi:hypothetical protein